MIDRIFEVWSEGYSSMGEHGPAVFHGVVTAGTFAEACDKLFSPEEHRDYYHKSKTLSYWMCKLYDNEKDARRSYG